MWLWRVRVLFMIVAFEATMSIKAYGMRLGEILHCNRKADNPYNNQAVTVICSGVTVGHMPRCVS